MFGNKFQTRAVFPLVNGKLRAVKGVELRTASKVYIPQGYELAEQFADDSKSVFNSEVKNIDFTKNVEAANEINTWVTFSVYVDFFIMLLYYDLIFIFYLG